MSSLRDLKKRIDTVKSTRKITAAMKMVAASKLRRAQEQAEAARPFSEHMARVISAVASGIPKSDDLPKLMTGTGKDEVVLIVLATSERGLCGAFNSSLARAVRMRIRALTAAGKQVKVLCVGKKGRDMLRREYGANIIDWIDMSAVRRLSFGDATPIAEQLAQRFADGEFDRCVIFFNAFESVMTQTVTEQQLIPVAVESGAAPALADDASYEAEPDEAQILADLLPRNLAVQMFHALLENAASEQGARMTAMDSATRNAGDMIDRLGLQYNRARQAAITTELIEIISGAEAL
ncbi:MAG: F0F1 ATP synthase subunit gamma [Proteobacteria bacterium]|nr:F0F1 ATP synthase subunit gamma [Pseudomonadota bacterium]